MDTVKQINSILKDEPVIIIVMADLLQKQMERFREPWRIKIAHGGR
jgi:hypothetical protein